MNFAELPKLEDAGITLGYVAFCLSILNEFSVHWLRCDLRCDDVFCNQLDDSFGGNTLAQEVEHRLLFICEPNSASGFKLFSSTFQNLYVCVTYLS